jgi:SAM-dependent methyltransferase
MTPGNADTHERAIRDQFSRQAVGFAAAPELHADDIVALVVDAAKPRPEDNAIDLACGPGTVACALAKSVREVIELDSTLPMLEQARGFARRQNVNNVEWRAGDVYQIPFADGSFNIVTCRFAFQLLAHIQERRGLVAARVMNCNRERRERFGFGDETLRIIRVRRFTRHWREHALGGFQLAQAAIPVLVQHGGGSLFFTGASASLRGKANFAPFASAKAAVRNLGAEHCARIWAEEHPRRARRGGWRNRR